MSLLIGFNPDAVEDTEWQEDVIVPEGKYRVILTSVKEEETRKSGTPIVRWKWTIIAGKMSGTGFETAHFPHSSEASLGAFMRHTKSLCRALNLAGVNAYDDLCDQPVIANIQVNKYTDKSGTEQEANRINYFVNDTEGTGNAPAQTVQRANPAPPQMASRPAPDYNDEPPPF